MIDDAAHLAERNERRRLVDAVQNLVAAERKLRIALRLRVLMIVLILVNLAIVLLAWNDVAGFAIITATVLIASLTFNVKVLTPEHRADVTLNWSWVQRMQQRYDEAFDRMIAAEQGEFGTATARAMEISQEYKHALEIEDEHRAVVGGRVFHCPHCSAPGHRTGCNPHDIAVPAGHERQIIGDNETWIVCHASGKPHLWWYDPYA